MPLWFNRLNDNIVTGSHTVWGQSSHVCGGSSVSLLFPVHSACLHLPQGPEIKLHLQSDQRPALLLRRHHHLCLRSRWLGEQSERLQSFLLFFGTRVSHSLLINDYVFAAAVYSGQRPAAILCLGALWLDICHRPPPVPSSDRDQEYRQWLYAALYLARLRWVLYIAPLTHYHWCKIYLSSAMLSLFWYF